MIEAIIRSSIHQRVPVLLVTLALLLLGIFTIKNTAVDAIPDLSDVQVIIKTSYPGQAPQVVEDQVTYPLTTAMLSVPKAATVRGYSFLGDSYVYVIFDEGTDLYWARSRVLEYLSQVATRLPAAAKPELGPDATGVGWIYQYALVDKSGEHNLAELRTLQDWFLKFELQTVPGVAEVATVGGMVKQYQVVVDPNKLRAFEIPLDHVQMAIQRANQEAGASVIEMAEAEYMVRASGYLQSVADINNVPLGLNQYGTPLLLGDIAEVAEGPQMRRGIAELNGEGEVVGGIVVMRYGENAQATIKGVKNKLAQLQASLPPGVETVAVYDRSTLIGSAIANLYEKLAQELLIVALVCAVFLFHFRSSLVVVISLPMGVLCAFIVMQLQGLNANIMSLGGIAIAIGVMVDGAIVMIENVHKHSERTPLNDHNRWQVIGDAAVEVGRPLFFSLLIVTVSFVPVFALQAQEGRLFAPLAFTKTYAMAAAAGLAITLVPVLMGYCIRGIVLPEHRNPVNKILTSFYRPLITAVLGYPKSVLALALLCVSSAVWPLLHIGSEFMPPLDEGDLMYMPTTYTGISIGQARQLLQQTDKLIATVPEVKSVFGKIGRADTATDPAPLTMIETIIQFHPRSQWRPGFTQQKLRAEMDSLLQFPGLSNSWVMPIKTRIDMLATGIKTPVGIKVAGPDLVQIEKIGQQIEKILAPLPGTDSVYAERVVSGRYIKIDMDRVKAARYGLNIADIQLVINAAIGGTTITSTVEGRQRFPVNLRYPQRYRDSAEQLKVLPIVAPGGEHIALADVARVYIDDGPALIKSENARLNGWIFINIKDRDLGSYVNDAQRAVSEQLQLPPGYSLNWAGQYEYMERANQRLSIVVPITIAIILLLLYLNFRNLSEVTIITLTLPFALVGGLWFIYLAGYELSVAVAVGFIALAGVSVEMGILMLAYLNIAWQQQVAPAGAGGVLSVSHLKQAIVDGTSLRLRPIMMTVAATIGGLLPIMIGHGTGSEVMQRIAGPMIGGMIMALLLSMLVIPVVFLLWRGRRLK